MPFSSFLHQHVHFDEGEVKCQHADELSEAEGVVDFHDCIACSISQLAHTCFMEVSILPLPLQSVSDSFFNKATNEASFYSISFNGRAPPTLVS